MAIRKKAAPRQWLDGDEPPAHDAVQEANREARFHARNVETLLRFGQLYGCEGQARRIAACAAARAADMYRTLTDVLEQQSSAY